MLGSLNVIYLSKAITSAEAIRRFVPELQRAAQEIVAGLEGGAGPA